MSYRLILKDKTHESKEIQDQTYNRQQKKSIQFKKSIWVDKETERIVEVELWWRIFKVVSPKIKLGDIETNIDVAIYEDQKRFEKVNPEFEPILGGHRTFELSNSKTIEGLFRVAEQLGLTEKIGDNRYKLYICRNYENEGWDVIEDKIEDYRWRVYEPHERNNSYWATNMIQNQIKRMFER